MEIEMVCAYISYVNLIAKIFPTADYIWDEFMIIKDDKLNFIFHNVSDWSNNMHRSKFMTILNPKLPFQDIL